MEKLSQEGERVGRPSQNLVEAIAGKSVLT